MSFGKTSIKKRDNELIIRVTINASKETEIIKWSKTCDKLIMENSEKYSMKNHQNELSRFIPKNLQTIH